MLAIRMSKNKEMMRKVFLAIKEQAKDGANGNLQV